MFNRTLNTAVNYNLWLEIAERNFRSEEEMETQARIVLARDFYEGELDDKLVKELADALLTGDADEVVGLINIYQTAVNEVADRLTVAEFEDDDGNKLDWAMDWWNNHNMDEVQHDLFENTLVDGTCFVILMPELNDLEELKIEPVLQKRYTSAEAGGENVGMRAHYRTNENSKRPFQFSKRWVEDYKDGQQWKSRQRMTLYTEGDASNLPSIQRYYLDEGRWKPFNTAEQPAIIPWTVNFQQDGEPLPLPIIEFHNQKERQEGRKAQGAQIIVDNLFTALLKAAGIAAIPPLLVLGVLPTVDGKEPAADGSNLWKVGPGTIIGNASKGPDQAKIDYVKPPDLSQMIAVIRETSDLTAVTAVIPSLLTRYSGGGETAAESLKQMDIRPTAITRKKQTAFGNSITLMFQKLVALNRLLKADEEIPADFTGKVIAKWLPADVRGSDVVEGTDEVDSDDEAQKFNTDAAPSSRSSGDNSQAEGNVSPGS